VPRDTADILAPVPCGASDASSCPSCPSRALARSRIRRPNPEAVSWNLIIGRWAETAAACTDDRSWTFAEGRVGIHGHGGKTCGFDRPFTDRGIDVVLDVLCPIPAETSQASARQIALDLTTGSPGLRSPGDRLAVTDRGATVMLQPCP
jgi:hypothetical protein